MNRKQKTLLGAGGASVAVGVAVAMALSNASKNDLVGDSGRDTAGMVGTQGMEGMAGMDMGGTAMDGSIHLTADEVATFGITFGTADVRPLSRTVRAVGLVGFDETRMAYVAPKFGGWVERLHVDFTGQPVRRGQPLLEVYSPELVAAQEELLLAARMAEAVGESQVENVAEGARDLYASARRRLAYWDISEQQIDRLLETREVRKTLTLYAPVSGVVMEKDVFRGAGVPAGEEPLHDCRAVGSVGERRGLRG